MGRSWTVPTTILERIAAGDPSAIDECIDRYGGLVWSLVRRLGSDDADAEDAVQEIFIELWRTASRFDSEVTSEATFVTMIARRRLIDRYRKRARQAGTVPIGEDSLIVSAEVEERVELAEEVARARELLAKLRPEERQVLELSINQGLSQSQIAQVMSLPLGTVKTHARRGLLRLRQLLNVDPVDCG